MEFEDDKNVLQHLLDLEADAADLVENAKTEADRRLSEAEKVCRVN
jgi:vacuolar-type H+-ATPase subunit H